MRFDPSRRFIPKQWYPRQMPIQEDQSQQKIEQDSESSSMLDNSFSQMTDTALKNATE